MGVPAPAVELLLEVHRREPLRGPALTLGVLDIEFVPALRCRALASAPRGFVQPEAFFAHLGILSLESLDIAPDEGATITHDLAQPLPAEHAGRYGLVVDGGTLEHVADVFAALENITRLLAPGGRVVHVAPVSGWENHGFFCPQPKLFFRAYAENGFSAAEGWLLHSPRAGGAPIVQPIGADVGEFETDSRADRTLLFFTAIKGARERPFMAPIDSHLTKAPPTRTLKLREQAPPAAPLAAPTFAGRVAARARSEVSRVRERLSGAIAPLVAEATAQPPASASVTSEVAQPGPDMGPGMGPGMGPPAEEELYWTTEPDFARIFATGTGIFGNGPRDRYYTLKELLLSLGRIEADTAECGVFEGFGSYVLRSYLPRVAAPGVRHHLFDSFAGLSEPTEADRAPGLRPWRRGDMLAGLERVQRNLSMFDDLAFHAGWIPACFEGLESARFAFVHLDVDLHDPTRAALEFFFPRLVSGGLLVIDDHGFKTCPGARRAADEYAAKLGVPLVRLTTGQAFLRGR